MVLWSSSLHGYQMFEKKKKHKTSSYRNRTQRAPGPDVKACCFSHYLLFSCSVPWTWMQSHLYPNPRLGTLSPSPARATSCFSLNVPDPTCLEDDIGPAASQAYVIIFVINFNFLQIYLSEKISRMWMNIVRKWLWILRDTVKMPK